MNNNFTTFPNQKIIHINKPKYTGDYLSVGNDEWIEASKNLKPITFRLYLYLASNADNFDLILSRQAVMNRLGISKNSYIDGIKELEDKHYIVPKQGNVYDFHTTPMYQSDGTVCTTTMVQDVPVQGDSMYQSSGTEITKTNIKNNLSKDADAKRVFNSEEDVESLKEELDEFNTDKLKELLRRFELGKTDRITHGYKALKKDFGIKSKIDKNLGKIVKDMIDAREYLEKQLKLAENCYIPEYTGGAQYQRKTKEHNPMFNDMW